MDYLFPSQLEDPGRFNMQKPLLSLRAEGLFQYFFKGSNFAQYPANSKTSIAVITAPHRGKGPCGENTSARV